MKVPMERKQNVHSSNINVVSRMASVLLLGIADDKQQLSVNMRFMKDSALRPITVGSDLSAPLDGFNTDKPHPLVIGGTMVETPTIVGIVTSIDNWEVVDVGSIEANNNNLIDI